MVWHIKKICDGGVIDPLDGQTLYIKDDGTWTNDFGVRKKYDSEPSTNSGETAVDEG